MSPSSSFSTHASGLWYVLPVWDTNHTVFPSSVAQLPYKMETRNVVEALNPFRLNSDVVALRNLHRADMTMLVGWFSGGGVG